VFSSSAEILRNCPIAERNTAGEAVRAGILDKIVGGAHRVVDESAGPEYPAEWDI